MSTNLNYKQVANVKRRTWDVEEYEQKAKARAEAQDAAAQPASGQHPARKQQHRRPTDGEEAARKRVKLTEGDDDDAKEEFMPAEPGAAGPQGSERAFLQPRRGKVDISSKIGATEMISAEAAAKTSLNNKNSTSDGPSSAKDGVTKSGVGWHCSVCDCFLKDSMTYLDHINGRKHQRKLGFSMRVERSSKDQMLGRLSQLTKEKERKEKKSDTELEIQETNYRDVVKQKDEEEAKKKAEKAKRRKEKKEQKRLAGLGPTLPSPKEAQPEADEGDEAEEEEEEEGGINPDMAAMMGFSGFGGSSK